MKILTNREYRKVVDCRMNGDIGCRMVRPEGFAVWAVFNNGAHAVVITRGGDAERYHSWSDFLDAYTFLDN
ncbi:hypothetical protein RU58_00025 [Achromobacter phage phiAxp-1]|uniref:hypothetical protein n=1 Tax=Achromobacter phage phiAxp-1 TaxID=1610509 RepID=UPI000656142C|nr:hypothetical protein RU58_00025 [Achromobacter phage phiAxp-1]AKJ71414.1 hypothetical protein RU58_00025 [Achromobacter phage phiAxp-1]